MRDEDAFPFVPTEFSDVRAREDPFFSLLYPPASYPCVVVGPAKIVIYSRIIRIFVCFPVLFLFWGPTL